MKCKAIHESDINSLGEFVIYTYGVRYTPDGVRYAPAVRCGVIYNEILSLRSRMTKRSLR